MQELEFLAPALRDGKFGGFALVATAVSHGLVLPLSVSDESTPIVMTSLLSWKKPSKFHSFSGPDVGSRGGFSLDSCRARNALASVRARQSANPMALGNDDAAHRRHLAPQLLLVAALLCRK